MTTQPETKTDRPWRQIALRIEHLSKTFPGTRALRDVSLEVESGTIHCLLGGNGSGKSSLIKILAGVYQGDAGGTIWAGEHTEPADRATPEWARSAGLHFVHQDLAVFGGLSVAENLAIGRGFPVYRIGAIRWRMLNRRAHAVLDRFHIAVDPKRLLSELRPADRTMVAIARALQDQSLAGDEGILILDEPTVALPSAEVDVLFGALRQYAKAGQTILLVTHRLEEVVRIADRVTVLRDGSVSATLDAGQFDQAKLVELIVGRTLDDEAAAGADVEGEDLLLEVSGLSGGPLRGVSFGLHRGEVLGVAGLLGSGRTTLLTTLFGSTPSSHGTVQLNGQLVAFTNVDQAMDAGLAFVPENRSDSAFLEMDLTENLSAADLPRYWSHFILHQRREAEDARTSIAEFSIKANSVHQPFATLSGGNQQKAVVARWLRRKPRLLLLDEPTQGVDIEARGEIYRLVRKAVAAGTSVIVVTSDFEELARVADRVVVLAHGQIAGELRPPNIEPARITELVLSTSALGSNPNGSDQEMERTY